jgi:hypothetical protein
MLKSIYTLVSKDSSPADAELAVEPMRERISGQSYGYISSLRSRMRGAGFDPEVVDTVFPKASGRKAHPKGPWSAVTGGTRRAIEEALGSDVEQFPWDAGSAMVAAEAVVEHFKNPSSASSQLSRFRKVLRDLDVPAEVVSATFRPKVTTASNNLAETARAAAAESPITPPDEFQRIADLRERVDGYLRATTPKPSAQMVADLMVSLSARPTEINTLNIGPGGGLLGVLKKRGDVDVEMPIVSAIGSDDAAKFLTLWRGMPKRTAQKAVRDLKALTDSWGINPKDLRAIGSDLAVRMAELSGEAASSGQAREVQVAALRHKAPTKAAAVDYYNRVDDGTQGMAAKLAEADPATLQKIQALLGGGTDQPPSSAQRRRRRRRKGRSQTR